MSSELASDTAALPSTAANRLEEGLLIMLKSIPPAVARGLAPQRRYQEALAGMALTSDDDLVAKAVVEAANPEIDAALETADRAYTEALIKAGMPSQILALLGEWLDLHSNTRAVQRQIEITRALAQARPPSVQVGAKWFSHEDPMRPLTAAQLGEALGGVTDETVRLRDKAGTLFSVLHPGRKRGREYPAFQAWADIAGAPLARMLQTLGAIGSTAIHGFFRAPSPELAGLTPVEAMIGEPLNARQLGDDATALLAASQQDRLDAVMQAAAAFAADVAA